MLAQLQREIRALRNPKKAEFHGRFFKAGPGEYAEGDVFLGLTVPQIRALAQKHRELSLAEISRLLKSEFHERLLALLLWVHRFRKGNEAQKTKIYETYLSSTRFINNWDLVDSSAEHIVGAHLFEKSRAPLHKLSRSKNLWEKRISILATFHFIKKKDFEDTLRISETLLQDDHDLIHKATGWMLREVGKRDLKTEESFLKRYYQQMPRTMLRYAIEKFPEKKRKAYLKGQV